MEGPLVWTYQLCPSEMLTFASGFSQFAGGASRPPCPVFVNFLLNKAIRCPEREIHNSALFADIDNLLIDLGEPASTGACGYTHPPSKHH